MHFRDICAVRWHNFLRNPRKSYSKNRGLQHKNFWSLLPVNNQISNEEKMGWVPDSLKLKKLGAVKPPTHEDFGKKNARELKLTFHPVPCYNGAHPGV
ncbi:hypothetical protein CLOSTHATH_06286 [Hungatella hathewayi DSM 13479]|uniref:Uncharacterized protein n=1 Tax=Hungatella hathewayi DSM 13479 TaxID=566550 RepID=D3ARN1_9FIRM|nr:hypothetical protein CLOSTHATH_06286 [Hungatella hathewayi DSM 13479]